MFPINLYLLIIFTANSNDIPFFVLLFVIQLIKQKSKNDKRCFCSFCGLVWPSRPSARKQWILQQINFSAATGRSLLQYCLLNPRFGLNNMSSPQKDRMIYFRIVLVDHLKSYIWMFLPVFLPFCWKRYATEKKEILGSKRIPDCVWW